MKSVLVTSLLASGAYAFPFVAEVSGVDSSLFGRDFALQRERRQQSGGGRPGGEKTCPFNKNHKPANPITAKYPYNGAINGSQGKGKGGFLVPAPGDTAHYFKAPGPNDVRGPCPGLNAAANHQFLAHDGITTFQELVDAQQNIYNVGYDLANLLAALGLTLTDGDPVTMKLSIGCDATSRTSYNPTLTGHEPGLDGHNKFEADTSLTRNDYFTANGDNYEFNGTLFGMMQDTAKGNFSLNQLALYRYQRYQQSVAENSQFYFGPLSLLLFGAASFLYELMPGGPDYLADLPTISSFFGAEKKGNKWVFNGKEKIPPKWTNRVTPYTNMLVTNQILEMYALHPVLFGGNTASGHFDTISFGAIKNGSLPVDLDPADTACLLYQLATERIPTSLNSVVTPSVDALAFIAKFVSPQFANLGCPIGLTK